MPFNNHHHLHSHAAHLARRVAAAVIEAQPAPDSLGSTSSILRRSSDSASDSEKRCGGDESKPGCAKPVPASTQRIGIIAGAVIPIVAAIVVLLYLHRRHIKKQRIEDANDRHKSLDFGLGDIPGSEKAGKGTRGFPEMSDADRLPRLAKGVSMDLDLGNPYLLPAGLHGSRESLHSLSRSAHDGEDPYRPVNFVKGDNHSIRAHTPRFHGDNESTRTGSSGGFHDGMNSGLLRNAQKIPKSMPPTAPGIALSSGTPNDRSVPSPADPAYVAFAPNANSAGLTAPPSAQIRDSYFDKQAGEIRKSNNYLKDFLNSGGPLPEPAAEPVQQRAVSPPPEPAPTLPQVQPPQMLPPNPAPLPSNSLPTNPRPPRVQSIGAISTPSQPASRVVSESSDYSDILRVTPPSPRASRAPNRQSMEAALSIVEEYPGDAQYNLGLDYDVRRLSMGVRPLPPDDPSDNPEQRANRIRSFYKEYFDDSKADPAKDPANYPAYVDVYEDYSQEYANTSAVYDAYGPYAAPQAPHAQPMPRRAMTPPPRGPPRFQSTARSSGGSSGRQPMPYGSRTSSAMSGRPQPGGRAPPKKAGPPPAPLTTLPTPHLLKEDSMVFTPIDFAPPSSFRDRQAGRPDSPLGVRRPYSPTVRPHLPLASSFDDLSVMPSPHHLRKSGTFTALDFAPPPRFKHSDAGSDAGSIRSNRSGMSNVQLHSLRAGAYRASRIPKEVAGTRHEMNNALRPTWEMRAPMGASEFK